MSARISRLATALFAVLSAAMAINLTVMQPGARLERVADRSGMWGAVRETAALAVPELDQRLGRPELPVGAPAGAASRVGGPVPTNSGPLTPGIAHACWSHRRGRQIQRRRRERFRWRWRRRAMIR